MAAIDFPPSPTVGQKHPPTPVVGIPTYTWDGEKWTTIGGDVAAYAKPATVLPLVNATPAVVGIVNKYAREDHVHPTDTTRAATADLPVIPATATAVEYISNIAAGQAKTLTPGAVWTAAANIVTSSGASLTPDFGAGADFAWTITGTGPVNSPTNIKIGQKGIIYIIQGGAGSFTITWDTKFKFPSGIKPVLSTAAGSLDAVSYAVLSATQIACNFSRGLA